MVSFLAKPVKINHFNQSTFIHTNGSKETLQQEHQASCKNNAFTMKRTGVNLILCITKHLYIYNLSVCLG